MAKLNDLNIDSITNANDVKIPFVIVFTYLDDYVETFVKRDKLWKQFEKQFQNDRPKEDYYAIDDIKIDTTEDNEPFKDKEVAIIPKDLLSTISEKDKVTLDFGIRAVDEEENLARVFPDDMLDYFQLGNINNGIKFDDVEGILNEVMKQTMLLNNAESKQQETQKLHEEKRITSDEDNQNEEPSKDDSQSEVQESEYETFVSDEKVESKEKQNNTTTEETESSITEDTQEEDTSHEQNRTPIKGVPSKKPEENAEIRRQNEAYGFTFEPKNPETPLELAQADLYYEIESKIPEIQLPQLNYIPDDVMNDIADSNNYNKVLTIKRLTEEKLNNRSRSTEKYLQNLRYEAISKIYNKLNRRLNVENDELLRKSDFTSEYSPFSENYQSLQSHYKKIIDSLSDTKHAQIEQNRKNHEVSKKAYVNRAAEKAAEEFDHNNLHLIEENAQNYIEDIKNDADEQYNTHYEGLEKDSQNWYVKNFNTLVPKIVQSSIDEIEKVSGNITEQLQNQINELKTNMESDYDNFVNRMKDITEKEIETDKNNELLIDKAVHERTSEYPDLYRKIEGLESTIGELEKKNKEAFEQAENNRREFYSEKKRNEALQTSIDNRDLDVKAANDRYHHLTNLIANGKVEQLNKILEKDRVTPVKESFLDKMKNFTTVIAATILSLAIIIGFIIFGSMSANSSEEQISQADVKSEVQQAVKKSNEQHDEEQKKSNEQHAQEQEKSNQEIEQLKKDLDAEKSKNKKDDKKDDK
ncbi:hypothetical protein [Mammaliicoccus lentus]|uniref:hypothetical protein n=1 Tax=Mammaliicoccus lentus TaxID=42858 RepID=UPI0010721ECA|nr:hypothetical protein [Mammaliicoccus lentus]MBF0795256.1 hypothetical protein [Mammaliicoccus lentus]TFV14652.1 hypothetical protein E4T78_11350 [Mammaliicoccus lentus]